MSEELKIEYQLLEEIGRGRFGVVRRCFSPVSGEFFAVKSVNTRSLRLAASAGDGDSTDLECVENEPKILLNLPPHPSVLRLRRVFSDDHHLHLVTDLCDAADLFDRLASSAGRRLPEPEASSVLRPIVDALAHCHRHGVAHRDVKPDNVLFDARSLRPRLADFGSAAWLGESRRLTGVVGTPYYVAPEVVMGREYDEKVDVWSAGVVMYVMLAGVPPFYGETAADTFAAVVRGNLRFPAKLFRSVSPAAKDLMRKMICRDASRRYSAEQVLRHPWVLSGGQRSSEADVT